MDPSIEVLWGEGARPRRGPKPSLNLERIVAAAIPIADAEGLPALSMQKVADDLGVTKMALYRYLPGKTELIALMVEAVMGPPPRMPYGWRQGLKVWALELTKRYERHPWTLPATEGVRIPGPNELGWTEAALTAMDGTGLGGGEKLDTIVLVNGHVRGLVRQAVSEREYTGAIGRVLELYGERYPKVKEAIAATASTGQDRALDFGLDRILDGIGLLVDARA